MAKSDVTAVGAAFEMLLEEIEGLVESINAAGARAFQEGKHGEAEAMLAQAKAITEFRERITSLRQEWDSLSSEQSAQVRERSRRTYRGKVRKGERTPQKAYYIPILRSLEEKGGRGTTADVCDAVYRKMKDVLGPVDFERLPSPPHEQRWRNAAQWARNSMVNEGLLSSDSPRGIWEITGKGRVYLERNA